MVVAVAVIVFGVAVIRRRLVSLLSMIVPMAMFAVSMFAVAVLAVAVLAMIMVLGASSLVVLVLMAVAVLVLLRLRMSMSVAVIVAASGPMAMLVFSVAVVVRALRIRALRRRISLSRSRPMGRRLSLRYLNAGGFHRRKHVSGVALEAQNLLRHYISLLGSGQELKFYCASPRGGHDRVGDSAESPSCFDL